MALRKVSESSLKGFFAKDLDDVANILKEESYTNLALDVEKVSAAIKTNPDITAENARKLFNKVIEKVYNDTSAAELLDSKLSVDLRESPYAKLESTKTIGDPTKYIEGSETETGEGLGAQWKGMLGGYFGKISDPTFLKNNPMSSLTSIMALIGMGVGITGIATEKGMIAKFTSMAVAAACLFMFNWANGQMADGKAPEHKKDEDKDREDGRGGREEDHVLAAGSVPASRVPVNRQGIEAYAPNR